jgi:pimeloyl-ACP methyl ester carboxylesterase
LGEPDHDLEEYLKTAKALRRAIDLLITRPNVNAERIAYVGHSLGALFGGVLGSVEKRLKTSILMAGVGSFLDIAVLNLPGLRGQSLDQYRRVLAPIDPLYFLPFAAPSPLLFQFGFEDRSFPRDKFIEFAAAGSEPKAVKWYNADHHMLGSDAQRDRLEWLRTPLNLVQQGEAQPDARVA